MDELRNSVYDGIQEYDNDLPKWWVWLFYITILFALGYTWWYHFAGTLSTHEQLALDLKEAAERQAAKATSETKVDESSLLALVSSSEALSKGKVVFDAKCAACHGPEGQGLVGPNLTDKYFIHGATLLEALKVVEKVVLDKGMLAWKNVLPDEDINSVVAYTYSIRGTNPANPKAPQGDLIEKAQ